MTMTPLSLFTLVHIAISIAGIAAGFAVLAALIDGRHLRGWAAWFLGTTVATSVTGFFFPFEKLLPSHIVGILSLIVLVPALYGLYRAKLAGRWRTAYVAGSVIALYFNTFVLVAQLFAKVPALKEAAPTQAEPPFAATQALVLAIFVWLGVRAVKGFRPASPAVGG